MEDKEMEKEIRYLSDNEVAVLTGMSVQTLRNWRFEGKGPAYSKIGRSVRYAEKDIIEYMENRRIEPRNN